ncbi:MAG: fluoride efflux transporter CrcB [Pseudohongiellaceae bacterium]
MNLYLFIAAGGALGAMSRYWLVSNLDNLNSTGFPMGVFTVNVIGSFLLGAAFVLISEKLQLAEQWRSLVMVGFLGAFTTFSTFSLDALLLFQQGHYNTAFLYIAGSVMLCLVAVFAGIHGVRIFF